MEADKKNEEIKCGACYCELTADHHGIRCKQGHDLCPECAKTYVGIMLAEPDSKIPARCSCCNVELSAASVEMQMTPEQLDIYLFYMSKSIAKETDQVARCPFCSYFEFWGKNSTSNFFFCKKEGCKKGSCSICHREFKVPSNGFNITQEEFEEIKSDTGMMSHTKCYQYKQIKDDWEKALEEGIKRKCPS